MNERELRALIADHEAGRVEFTVSTTDTTKFSEAVCAFANDLPNHEKPGHLMIGVDDRGAIVGVPVTDELLRNLGSLRSDGNIQPLPDLTVEKTSRACSSPRNAWRSCGRQMSIRKPSSAHCGP